MGLSTHLFVVSPLPSGSHIVEVISYLDMGKCYHFPPDNVIPKKVYWFSQHPLIKYEDACGIKDAYQIDDVLREITKDISEIAIDKIQSPGDSLLHTLSRALSWLRAFKDYPGGDTFYVCYAFD